MGQREYQVADSQKPCGVAQAWADAGYRRHQRVAKHFGRLKAPQGTIWIQVVRCGRTLTYGNLRSNSVFVDRDKPIEVFLTHAIMYSESGIAIERPNCAGTYIRLMPEDVVLFWYGDQTPMI